MAEVWENQKTIDDFNKEVYSGLVKDHKRNDFNGYAQSHPFSQMFTGRDMAVDELTLMNNYMKIIFGGKPDPDRDNIDLAYNHSIKQLAEAPTQKENTLEIMNPLQFVESEQASKDSLMQTFAEERMYWKGQIDSDAERALKQRPTHDLVHMTTYGKNITPGGQAGRFNFVTGQHGYLQFRPNTSDMFPQENLSSKTYAPTPAGTEVPLNFANVYDPDPRVVPVDVANQKIHVGAYDAAENFFDTGSFVGREIDRYHQDYEDKNPTFASMFRRSTQRRGAQ